LPIDPAEKRKVFERLSSVRGIVFGVQDGVLTTAGVLCGLSGAVSNHKQIVLAALASTAAGALSMGAGAYLGGHAEAAILTAELEQARRESEAHPYVIQESLLEQLSKEGLNRDLAYRVVKLLSTSQQVLINTAEQKVYGLASGLLANPVTDGIVMGIAFMVGALVPLLPYFFIQSARQGLIAAMAATAAVLFIVGYSEGVMARRTQRWRSGIRFLAIAMSAAAAGYLIGLAISPLGSVAG
jgi:VIT1/CCC1 family predicted Fe2+/Mn2+ transporter